MRKKLFFIIAICFSVSLWAGDCFEELYPGLNLAPNPTYDSTADAGGWGNRGYSTDPEIVYCGSSCGRVWGGSFDQLIAWEPNTIYLVRAMVHANNTDARLGVFRIGKSDISYKPIQKDQWELVEFKFTTGDAPDNEKGGVFFNGAANGSNAYVDNLEVYKSDYTVEECLSQAAQEITLDTDYLGVGVRVPTEGLCGSIISWTCDDNTAVIDNETDVLNRIWIRIKRPEKGVKDVVLTAKITIGDESINRDFNVPIACGYAQDQVGRNKVKVVAENMAYEDPVYDGAADPTLVYNRQTKEWWIMYTQRRAAVDYESGVSWVYGSEIGMARSADGGNTWEYVGTAQGLALGKTPRDTYWAPEVIYNDGIYHMYLSYVTGVHSSWGGTATIEHYTSNDLINWTHQSAVPGNPATGIIDPCIFRLPDGRYAMWFKAAGTQTYVSYSDDLYNWGPSANINIGGGQEAPNVFFWNGKYRMLLDNDQRLTLYSSDDGIYWPMSSKTDIGGQHCDVVTQDGEAIFLYFAENYNMPTGKGNKTALFLNKLLIKDDGTIWCDHEAIYDYYLHAPEIRKMEIQANPTKLTYLPGQALDFSGLELSVHFADSMHDILKPMTQEDFEEYSITSSIAPGSQLKETDTEIILSTKYGGSVTIPLYIDLMETGIYEGTWESLKQYNEAPKWFQDAKFGIWAHWGPQCQPEEGDWYARHMYYPGHGQYNAHLNKYGNPRDFGFKDVINIWKAEKWDPEKLMALYKKAGAQYFVALGNHHDNMDLWDSKYQPWNSVNMGPKRDILEGWANAAKNNELPFGISIHASHAWTWYEGSQDYDGNLTIEDGAGEWWEGYDPQKDLYAQNHPRSQGSSNVGTIHSQWNWGNGAARPTEEYCNNIYNRTLDAINRYNPDLMYFDDTALPFYPINDVGVRIAAHTYNKSLKENGTQKAVILGKVLNEEQKECMVWDIERGIPDRIQEKPWQTCTCIGGWHYNIADYNNNRYKSAKTVIHMLVDIVSKNGNLLLSIPIKGDGSIDDKGEAVLKGIGEWMDINKESIYGTRPWKVCGEGPTADNPNPIRDQGFNEGISYSSQDIRYVIKDDVLYATVMGWPANGTAVLRNLGTLGPDYMGKVKKVELLGYGDLEITGRDKDGLMIKLPASKTNDIAIVFKISFDSIDYNELKNLITEMEQLLLVIKANTGTNTGQYKEELVSDLEQVLKNAKEISEDDDNATILNAFETLHSAFATFAANARSVGKSIDKYSYYQNITIKYLNEARNFSREPNTTTRFGKPKYWTVDNFNLPNGSDGIKQGIDKNPGFNTLMLGVWNDATGNVANAKIYKKVTLPAGKYFFGASYQTLYNTQKAYIFASEELPNTSDFETKALAFHKITTGYNTSAAQANDSIYGIEFTLDRETELNLGWLADLTISNTNEFRVKETALLRLLNEGDSYTADDATSAIVSEDILINMSEFARVIEADYKIQSDNSGYLGGKEKTSIYMGEIDFENNKYVEAFVYAANSADVDKSARFDFYLDNEQEPVVSVPAIKSSSSTSFQKTSALLPEITGIHKVSIKYSGHTSSVISAGFTDVNNKDDITHSISSSYNLYTEKGKVLIKNLNGEDIFIYSVKGIMVGYKTNVTGEIQFPLEKGTYIVKIRNEMDADIQKIIID